MLGTAIIAPTTPAIFTVLEAQWYQFDKGVRVCLEQPNIGDFEEPRLANHITYYLRQRPPLIPNQKVLLPIIKHHPLVKRTHTQHDAKLTFRTDTLRLQWSTLRARYESLRPTTPTSISSEKRQATPLGLSRTLRTSNYAAQVARGANPLGLREALALRVRQAIRKPNPHHERCLLQWHHIRLKKAHTLSRKSRIARKVARNYTTYNLSSRDRIRVRAWVDAEHTPQTNKDRRVLRATKFADRCNRNRTKRLHTFST